MTDGEAGIGIEHGHADYSVDELLEQAQANLQATVIATLSFLHERGLPIEDWTVALGRRFALAWGDARPWDAGRFMDAMLTNYRSMGAEVISVELNADRAEAVTLGFPDPDLCTMLGVDIAVAARFNDVTTAIARDRGLTWTWTLKHRQTIHIVERARDDG